VSRLLESSLIEDAAIVLATIDAAYRSVETAAPVGIEW